MIKTKNLPIILILLLKQISWAQIGINSNGVAPSSSAMLEITSTNKGLLIPRINLTSIIDNTTIPNPVASMMVFNSNAGLPEGTGYYAWNGSNWVNIKSINNGSQKGQQHYFTINVDGVTRNFYVHVPFGYNPATPTPMLIFMHGSGGSGGVAIGINGKNGSGWKEVGNEETIITAYPSALKYRIENSSNGEKDTLTIWNNAPDANFIFQPGQTIYDDVKFIKTMITFIQSKLNIDTHRIYMEGFSSGAEMTAKCTIEMSDILASASCNGGGFFLDNVTYTPLRLMPVLYEVGNMDYGKGGSGPTIPVDSLKYSLDNYTPIASPAKKNYKMSQAMIRNFLLNPNYAPIQGVTDRYLYADYVGLSGNPNNVYRHVFVGNLAHQYPNKFTEPQTIDAPHNHWKWMSQFVLP